MTTKPLTGFRHVTDKEGKVRVVKRAPRMAPVLARAQKAKADREEKQWLQRDKSTSTIGTDATGKASAARSRRGAK